MNFEASATALPWFEFVKMNKKIKDVHQQNFIEIFV